MNDVQGYGLSDFLFARPAFMEGLARLFDVGGTLTEFNQSPNGEIADWIALSQDWLVVGDDLRRAIAAYREEVGAPQ